MDKISVICFGEILWDILPEAKRPGGAPMNVAYHLQKLGVDSKIISRIGDDELGTALQDFVRNIGLDTETVQTDPEHETSAVIATINEAQEVSYEIVHPIAWDFIAWEPGFEQLLRKSQAFVFGSLASRNDISRGTLLKMLEHANYKVFDVNLREPHYTFEVVDRLLHQADLLKLNASELEIICKWYDTALIDEMLRIAFLFKKFDISEILITKGAMGATYYSREASYNSTSFKVKVNDTIGSGDSFLAAFLAMKLQGEDPQKALDYAVGMGAFITSQSGACPVYKKSDFEGFLVSQNPDSK
jgi:fructokinase